MGNQFSTMKFNAVQMVLFIKHDEVSFNCHFIKFYSSSEGTLLFDQTFARQIKTEVIFELEKHQSLGGPVALKCF